MRLRRPRLAMIIASALVLMVVVAAMASAQNAAGGGPPVLDGVQNIYLNAARGWEGRLVPIAQRTFVLLAAIEFAVSGIVWAIKRESLDDLAAKFLLKFTLIAFLLTLITSFNFWLPPIINGFVAAGAQVVGRDTMSPSAVLDVGRVTALTILKSLKWTVWGHDFQMGLFAVLAALIIAVSYILVAAQILLVMIESYVVILGGGVLFLAFAASRWTAAYAEHIIAHAFYLGARAFFLYLIVGVGVDIGNALIPLIQASDFLGTANYLFQVTGVAVMFAILAIWVPTGVAWRLMGRTSLGLSRAYEKLA